MKPEFKFLELKADGIDDTGGMIRGYASTFGNVDLGLDVVEPGAFKKTLKESGGGKVAFLADHNPTTPMGWGTRGEEDSKGLLVEGAVNMKDAFAVGRMNLAKMAIENGAKMGISIGYGTVKSAPDSEKPQVRRLKELKLYEWSLVVFPMNTAAMVTAAKHWGLSSSSANCLQDLVAFLHEQAKTLGVSPDDIAKALVKAEPPKSDAFFDPAKIGQSLDRLFTAITTT
jgi:uncharacterized protein